MYASTATVVLAKTGAPAGTIYAEIWSDDGETASLPSAIVVNPYINKVSANSSASESITATALTTGAGASETFRWSTGSPVLKPDTDYWLVLKTADFDNYANGSIEIKWRTDLNGATGLNECAKYDANASPAWTTIGADVGADITVSYANMLSLGGSNQATLYVDYTQGSSTAVQFFVEFSYDRVDWYQESFDSLSGGVILSTLAERKVTDDTRPARVEMPTSEAYMRISAKALTSLTNAEVGFKAVAAAV